MKKIRREQSYQNYRVIQYESRTIAVNTNGQPVGLGQVKSHLRELVILLDQKENLLIDINNGAGNPKNTRQLGDHIIKALDKLSQQ